MINVSVDHFESEQEYMNSVERHALDICNDHIRVVTNSVRYLGTLIENWINKGTVDIKSVDKLTDFESDADTLKKELIHHLSQAPTFLKREEFIRLILKIDSIADYVESTGFRLIAVNKWVPPKDVSKQIIKMMDLTIEVMDTLTQGVRLLSTNPEKADAVVERVDVLEREVDKIHRNLLTKLFHDFDDVKLLLRLREFLSHLEDLSDIGEEVADAIRIVAMNR